MTPHPNAKTNPYVRQLLVERVAKLGWSMHDAAQAVGVSTRTGWRWMRRFRDEGRPGLIDRRSRPHRMPRRTAPHRVRRIERLRRQRRTAASIARRLDMPRSTVAAVLRRLGLQQLSRLEPKPPVQRYEHDRPGDLLHLDTKKLGRIRGVGHRIHGDRRRQQRGIGWEYGHAAIDDHSRLGYVEMLGDERGGTAAQFLRRAVLHYRRRGVQIRAVLTDNGSCYVSKAFASACRELGIQHRLTRPYRPRTNGKAERFIQTLLREWAYARPYRTSNQRTKALAPWLRYYNAERPHSALGGRAPISRITRSV
jgi:transposase InsO family protein